MTLAEQFQLKIAAKLVGHNTIFQREKFSGNLVDFYTRKNQFKISRKLYKSVNEYRKVKKIKFTVMSCAYKMINKRNTIRF